MWDVHLSPFLPWERRGEHRDAPGVYAVATGNADNIIYIGLTVQSDGLRGRLRQFHRSATTGQPGHAGGVTYHQRFGPDVFALLVAVHFPHAVNTSATVMGAYVQYAERLLIWRYVARHGELPACNSA